MNKPFKTIDEQIEILRSRKMIVDSKYASKSLMKNGYYNIINGYKDFFLKENSNDFLDGTNFIDLETLFKVDKILSQGFFYACLDIERTFKTNLAYFIAEKYGEKENEYLKKTNYSTGKNLGNNRWQRDETIKIFNKLLNEDIQPIQHYRKKYNNVPPWILFSRATFGNVYYLYKLSKSDIKTKVISSILDINPAEVDAPLKQLFSDAMLLVLYFRNRTAHANRAYNFTVKVSGQILKYHKIFYDPFKLTKQDNLNGICRNDVFAFIASVYFLDKEPYEELKKKLIYIFYSYKFINSKNYNKLLRAIGIPEPMINCDIADILP
ncbi:Abi family protein [Ezakiella peruensis]|uniref:Abi family protein n=1 Tax=Ezakiella peruensis TaxID=1464038 RepID=UPI000C1B2F56|nr:Abi family protein [Ezakiella peruensis]